MNMNLRFLGIALAVASVFTSKAFALEQIDRLTAINLARDYVIKGGSYDGVDYNSDSLEGDIYVVTLNTVKNWLVLGGSLVNCTAKVRVDRSSKSISSDGEPACVYNQ